MTAVSPRAVFPSTTGINPDIFQIGRQGFIDVSGKLAVITHQRPQAVIHIRCQSEKQSHSSAPHFRVSLHNQRFDP